MAPFRQSRQNRSGRSQADHDVFEGLPIRQWRRTESSVNTTSESQLQDSKKRWPELPMPRDSTLLPEWSQQLLRAARAGRLFEPPTNTLDSTGEKNDVKKNGDAEHDLHSNDQHCITVKKWTRAPRHLEEPEQDYLAKRRKGLPSLRNGIAGSLGFGGAMRKTKIRKVDSEGNTNVWQVLVPEGQSVEGEITNEEELSLAVAKQTAPGTVIEGVGAVNSNGLVVVNDGLISTPPRRRPPPPRRKPKKGPGRGRKKVIFKSGEEGAETKPDLFASGVQEVAAADTISTSITAQGQDKDVTMTDMPEVDDNEEEGEDEEDEGEVEEGEDDEDDREEGELSPSSPGPSEIQAPASDESQSRRKSVSITEAYPKPELHPLPAALSSTSGLPPKPVDLELSGPFPQNSQQQQQAPGQVGSAASPSALMDATSRSQAMGRDRDLQESRPPVSLVPQHLFGATIPPAPKPQHSSSLSTKSIKSPTVSDSLAESRFALAAVSDANNLNEAANNNSVPPLRNIESQDHRIPSSSPDLPLVEALPHSRKSSQNIDFSYSKQEHSVGQVDELQHIQQKSKGMEAADDPSIAQTYVQDHLSKVHEQTAEPTNIGHSEPNVGSETLAVESEVIDHSYAPSIFTPRPDAVVATTGVAAAETNLVMDESQNQITDGEPNDNGKHEGKAALPETDIDSSPAPPSSSSSNAISSTTKTLLETTSQSPKPGLHNITSSTSETEAIADSTTEKTHNESGDEQSKETINQKEAAQKSPPPAEVEQQGEQRLRPEREDRDGPPEREQDRIQIQAQAQAQAQAQTHDQERARKDGDAGTTVTDTVAGTGSGIDIADEKSSVSDIITSIAITDAKAVTGGDEDISTNSGAGAGVGIGNVDLLGTLERRLDAKEENGEE